MVLPARGVFEVFSTVQAVLTDGVQSARSEHLEARSLMACND
jgi:hypothetical protein